MHQDHHSTSPPHTPPLRTYRQIAQIIAAQTGTAMTQAHVGRMCRAAEMKIEIALRADPDIQGRLRFGAVARD